MTEQQVADGDAARLEISASGCYTRAVGSPRPAGQKAPAPPAWMPVPTPEEEAYPLRARGADLQRRYHRQHAAATTPRDELAVLTDYVRAGLGSADRAGMRDPKSAAAVRAAIAALREAGDTLTARMNTWSPS